MAYVGNTPTTQSFISGTDYFNGDGATIAFTLSRAVVSVNDIEAVVNNVVQQPNTAYTISGTTITFTSAPSSGTSNIYVRYLSTTTQSVTPSQNTVSYSTLNSDNQSKLGISFKNRIINGAGLVAQRTTGTTTADAGGTAYPIDRFRCFANGGGVFTAAQSSTVPSGAGFVKSVYMTVTTPDSSIASGDYYSYSQYLEGLNTSDLEWGTANAKTITVSFWCRSSVTGTYVLALLNNTGTRGYPATFTISAADTWQQVSLTITGCTDGVWATDNTTSIIWRLDLGSGSNNNGTANIWNSSAGSYTGLRTSSSTNWIATNGATFYITGVQLEVGTQATTFDYRSIGTELALCQRYCFVMNSAAQNFAYFGTGVGTGTTSALVYHPLPVTMRAVPSVSYSAASTFIVQCSAAPTATAVAANAFTTFGVTSQYTTASGLTGGGGIAVYANNTASAFHIYSAEL